VGHPGYGPTPSSAAPTWIVSGQSCPFRNVQGGTAATLVAGALPTPRTELMGQGAGTAAADRGTARQAARHVLGRQWPFGLCAESLPTHAAVIEAPTVAREIACGHIENSSVGRPRRRNLRRKPQHDRVYLFPTPARTK
jgi:hypothetical protein